jgi:DNA-binding transcriptional ArsR family regulator
MPPPRNNSRSSIDARRMQAAAHKASSLLGVLANENRLMLMCQLSQGEKSVAQLEELLQIRQPTLSQQLAVLRAKKLVRTRREGRSIHYSVADPGVLGLLETLYALYCPKP